jgi:hypothetical protein
MDKPKIRKPHGPEYGIQKKVVTFLRERGWHVERLIGVGWQYGLPDLFACHRSYGMRFIEIKNEDHYVFTKQQRWKFPLLMQNGCGIWILTDADEFQYNRLFREPNLWDYLKPEDCFSQAIIDEILKELEGEEDAISE